MFAPYWDDLYLVNAGTGVFTTTTGSAGDRHFYLEWRAEYFPGTGTANFEVEFDEADGIIRAIYGQLDNGNSSSTEGVQSVDDAIFDQYGCNGTGDVSAGTQVTYTPGGAPPPPPPPPPPPRHPRLRHHPRRRLRHPRRLHHPAASTTTATSAASASATTPAPSVQAALRGPERGRQDAGTGEGKPAVAPLPLGPDHAQVLFEKAEEPRGQPEPARRSPAGQRRSRQPHHRQGAEAQVVEKRAQNGAGGGKTPAPFAGPGSCSGLSPVLGSARVYLAKKGEGTLRKLARSAARSAGRRRRASAVVGIAALILRRPGRFRAHGHLGQEHRVPARGNRAPGGPADQPDEPHDRWHHGRALVQERRLRTDACSCGAAALDTPRPEHEVPNLHPVSIHQDSPKASCRRRSTRTRCRRRS